MNDDDKIVNQTANPVAQADQAQPQTTVQPVAPVGSVSKETGPANANLSEFVRPSGPEVGPNLPQEVSESGVEVRSDKPDLTFAHKELGVRHAGSSIPISTTPSNSVQYPMSEDEVADKLKTSQDDDSGKWLSKLIQKIMKVMGL